MAAIAFTFPSRMELIVSESNSISVFHILLSLYSTLMMYSNIIVLTLLRFLEVGSHILKLELQCLDPAIELKKKHELK